MDSAVWSVGLREREEFASLWGSGGFFDHMSLAQELVFRGDQDGFGSDSRWELGFEGPPEVGRGDGGLALPSRGLAHRGDGFACRENQERTDPDQQYCCFGGGVHH